VLLLYVYVGGKCFTVFLYQVWQMAENIYNEDDGELEGGEKPDEPKAEKEPEA